MTFRSARTAERSVFRVYLHWLLSPAWRREHNPQVLRDGLVPVLFSAALGRLRPSNLLWPKDQIMDSDKQKLTWPQTADCRPLPMRTLGGGGSGTALGDKTVSLTDTVRIQAGWWKEDASLRHGFSPIFQVTVPSKNQYYRSFPGPGSICHHTEAASRSVLGVAHSTVVCFQASHHHSILNPFDWFF